MQGVIVTQGNVTINGDIQFSGVIIAGGTITINNGNHDFYNSDALTTRYLVDLIRGHSELRSLFNITGLGLIQIFYPDVITSSGDSNTINTYKELVGIDRWRLN